MEPCVGTGRAAGLIDKERIMQATDELSAEHRVIERVLGSLEAMARRLTSGQKVRPQFFLEAADFIKNFADGCHHRKEEGILFIKMVECGMPKEHGPIAVMLAEHEQGRAFTRGMREAAERLAAGDGTALAALVQNAQGYAGLLRQHISKEDQVLFPMADRVIPAAEHAAVHEAFQHVEHDDTGPGVHQRYLALAEALEREAQG
jgi:hemerythrin-like domain-containing protein